MYVFQKHLDDLSRAAQEVMIMTMAGHTSKEIAHIRGTTDKNIRTIRSRIYKKYKVSTYRELIKKVSAQDISSVKSA